MAKRITIMIDDELDKKLRIRQSKEIRQTQKSVSFSKTINNVLRTGLNNQEIERRNT